MKIALLLGMAAIALAQVEHGADVFAKTCASGYCHGPNGAGGGAPKLVGRGFDEAFIVRVTRAGVEGTAMHGYGTVLTRPDFNAVVAYVASLNGIEARNPVSEVKTRVLSGEAARGRELFFDATRGFGRCATCHEADGMGIGVAAMGRAPQSAAAMRGLGSANVRTAVVDGDRFPALVVSQGGRRTVLYDLTGAPPVLRSVESGSVKFAGAAWDHRDAVKGYTDAEIEAVLTFLRALAANERK